MIDFTLSENQNAGMYSLPTLPRLIGKVSCFIKSTVFLPKYCNILLRNTRRSSSIFSFQIPRTQKLNNNSYSVRSMAKSFAADVLATASTTYSNHATQKQRFQSLRPFYAQATAGGMIRGLIPPSLGGQGGAVLDSALLVEELFKVDRSLSLTILSTGLGLSPLLIGGTKELQGAFLKPFISGNEAPLASLVQSEPGGTANFLEKGGKGLATTARRDGGEWVINGEKVNNLGRNLKYNNAERKVRCGRQIAQGGTTEVLISNVLFADFHKMGSHKIQMRILRRMS